MRPGSGTTSEPPSLDRPMCPATWEGDGRGGRASGLDAGTATAQRCRRWMENSEGVEGAEWPGADAQACARMPQSKAGSGIVPHVSGAPDATRRRAQRRQPYSRSGSSTAAAVAAATACSSGERAAASSSLRQRCTSMRSPTARGGRRRELPRPVQGVPG
eukprot:scaffold7361_cov102-Isochrysis_galbana.AAC.1